MTEKMPAPLSRRSGSKILMSSTFLCQRETTDSGRALHELRRAVLPGGNEHHGDDLRMPAAQPGSEWNDLVYTGNWEQAYNRLKKTNNFQVYLPGMSGTLRGCLHLRALGRSGDLQGEQARNYRECV